MNTIDGILNKLSELERRIARLESTSTPRWVFLATPLTSTSWDGDGYSTAAKTVIDLSAVFSAPAGIKAVYVRLSSRDAASAAGSNLFVGLSPNNTAGSVSVCNFVDGIPNDKWHDTEGIVPCDANGDIYYQVGASGATTMDVIIQIWGYVI